MKLHYTLLSAIVAVLIFFASCHNHSALSPLETTEKFMTALQFGDYDEAKLYASDETAELLKFQSNSISRPFEEGFEILREEIDGDYAKVFYLLGDEEDEKFVRLKNSGSGWLVIMSKSELRPNSIFNNLNKSLDDGDDDWDSQDSGLSLNREGTSDEMKEVAKQFLANLDKGDIQGAMEYAAEDADEWLFLNGDDEENLELWANGHIVKGNMTMGKRGKVLYKINGKKPTYELKLRLRYGSWLVTDYSGPEEWEGLGENFPDAIKGIEKTGEEIGRAVEKSVEEAFKDAFK